MNYMDEELKRKKEEYDILVKIEIETTKTRHTIFTSLLSISFVIPGLSISLMKENIEIQFFDKTSLYSIVFMLGFIFYCFAVFHYWWYHRYSHIYRKRLKELEKDLEYKIYTQRKRPTLGKLKGHFDWTLYIIGIIYGTLTFFIVGWLIFTIVVSFIILSYLLLMLLSVFSDIEPLEK